MKKYLFLILSLSLTLTAFAQHEVPASDPSVQEVVEKFTTKYQLDETQEAKMVKIQQRRLHNLSEVSALEKENPAKYLQKRKAINTGTEVSIKMMLTKEQRILFDQDRIAVRMKKAEKTAELKAQGMTLKQMEPYMLAIEDEQF